ncbi:MAG: hypothetical protein GVY26_14455 [Bacteroidetes bacterium]|nr:hypothetical protein [Bacteroidota bacterium]
MTRLFIPIAVFTLLATTLGAQIPSFELHKSTAPVDGVEMRVPCADNDAGTISFGPFSGQSNDVSPDTIFLCFRDSLPVLHNGDFVLDGDPDPSTAPGVGYAFYDCRPTVDGPDIGTVLTDPCLNMLDTLYFDGFAFPQPDVGLWLASAINSDGDITLVNSGFHQQAYTPGDGNRGPVQLWFAPITLDVFQPIPGFEDDMGVQGPCVSVSVDEAFSVVYLEEIQVTEVFDNFGPSLEQAIVVEGGLPQFDGNTNYTVSINPVSPGTSAGTVLTTGAGHGDTIRFTVPRPGEYELVVEDGKSCAYVDSAFEVPVLLSTGSNIGAPGDTVCVPVTVDNFVEVNPLQMYLEWDTGVLDFVSIENLTTDLPAFNSGIFNTMPSLTNTGQLSMNWFDPIGTLHTLPDGDVIFEVCFEVVGNLGDVSPIDIIGGPPGIMIGDANIGSNYPFVLNTGTVTVTNESLLVNSFSEDVSCSGDADGTFSVSVIGGVAPYTYSWNTIPPLGPDNTGTIAMSGDTITEANLAAGEYEIVITDSDTPANTVIDTVEIADGVLLSVNIATFQQPTCNGDSDGALIANVSIDGVEVMNPAAQGITFEWDVPGETGQILDGIPFSSHSVTVTNASGCTAMDVGNLNQPAILALPADSTETVPATCSGAMDGDITVAAVGGTTASGDYTYAWGAPLNDTIVGPSSQQLNLNPGQYTVTVIDDNGCTDVETLNVTAAKILDITLIDIADVQCNGADDGSITIAGTTSGQPQFAPFTYDWSALGTGQNLNGATITGLAPDTYVVTVTDQDPAGCAVVDSFEITEPDPIVIQEIDLQNESCDNGGNDGSVTIGVTGGTAPYTYLWSDMQMDSIATGLSEGTYTVDVEDANNCVESATFNITAPTPPQITALENDTVTCAGDTDGMLSVTAVDGGAPIAAYEWSNSETGTAISNLSPGDYFVTITAEDGCFTVDTASVIAPAPVVVDSIIPTSPSCVGEANGSLTVFANGGTEPYTYVWTNDPVNDTLTNVLYPGLPAGDYELVVIDANGCSSAVATQTVSDPAGIVVDFSDIQGVSCFDSVCDGQATASAEYEDGTQGTFNFIWASGEVELGVMMSTAIELCRDTQELNVTDANGCTEAVEFFVPSPDEIELTIDASNVSCAGETDGTATAIPSGGVGGFTFLWPALGETAATVDNLTAGDYTVEVTDANGCVKEQTVTLTEPDPLILSVDQANTQDVSCFGLEDGQIAVSYNFNDNINDVGDNPFSFSDNVPPPNASTDLGLAEGLPAGTFTVTITDVRGCQDSVMITLTEPSEIQAVIPDPEDPPCFDATTQVIIDTIFGGAGSMLSDYRYMVDGNGVLLTPDVPADIFGDGVHIIEIFDPNGCSTFDTVSIDQPEEIIVSFAEDFIEVELGDSTTQLEPIITPVGTQIDSFIWTPADYLSDSMVENPIVSPLESLEYTLEVVDENGCRAFGDIFVELDANRNIYIPSAFSPNGDGVNDEFRVYPCTGVTSIARVQVYDRWGNQVYEAPGPIDVSSGLFCANGLPLWEGNFRGDNLNMGTYVYIIEVVFLDGVRLVYRGDVNLLR